MALAAAREIVNLCGFLPPEDPERIHALAASFGGPALATRTSPALAARLAQNTANRPIAAPVLVAQGLADTVVPPAATDAYVAERCSAGQPVEYWTLADRDHGTIVQPGSTLEEAVREGAGGGGLRAEIVVTGPVSVRTTRRQPVRASHCRRLVGTRGTG